KPRCWPFYDAARAYLSTEAAARGDADKILNEASAIIEKYEIEGAEHAQPIAGAIGLLTTLNEIGAKVAIVTSNSSRTAGRWLQRMDLARCVNSIVGRDTLLPLKPAPDMIKRALEICGAQPAHSAFVGDSVADFQAASVLNLCFYGSASSPEARGRLITAGAATVFSSPAALAIELNLSPHPSEEIKQHHRRAHRE
ncbi:MAG TPA: HAD-IA family hydrolase, partial [Candidatus Binataceae bacterium]